MIWPGLMNDAQDRASTARIPPDTYLIRSLHSSSDEHSNSGLPHSYAKSSYAVLSKTPTSPPMETMRNTLTLPSIHNLIDVADASRVRHGNSRNGSRTSGSQDNSYTRHEPRRYRTSSGASNSPRNCPPTTPLHPHTSIEGSLHSPAMALSIRPYNGSVSGNVDSRQRRQSVTTYSDSRPSTSGRSSHSPQSSSTYSISPTSGSNYSFSSSSSTKTASPVYQKRSLPPPDIRGGLTPSALSMGCSSPVDQVSSWQQQQQQHQHHHYISHSSSMAFVNQQSERYICPTCNKAFSRPSSLRIHGHSHTGEKPFKCPHKGCGKAFSVRSNMKRHERGCHGTELGGRAWLALNTLYATCINNLNGTTLMDQESTDGNAHGH